MEFNKFFQAFKIKELRNKILMVAFLFVCFRALAAIPIPGVDQAALKNFFGSNQLFNFLGVMAGSTLSNLSIVMMGVSPYITATIIMQLLTMIFPSVKEMYYEEGAAGRAKFNRYSRIITVPLAMLSAYGFLNLLSSKNAVHFSSSFDLIKNVIIVTAGSMILMWIGELITEQKIGNGVSLLIFAGIISRIPSVVSSLIASYSPEVLVTYILFVAVAIAVIAGVVLVNQAERKIPISYAKQVRGNKMYGGVSSYLPIKVNQAGVIPIIFAISVLLFPQFIAQISSVFSKDLSLRMTDFVNGVFNNVYIHSVFYFILVVVFTYFYTAITFDPAEISKNLQRFGGFITGIRPGESTAKFLSKVTSRIILWGAVFLGLIAILPNVLQIFTGLNFLTIGGTAILIVVAVALESIEQIKSQLIMREYE